MVMMLITAGMPAATATTTGGTATAASLRLLPDQHHLERDLLKCQLIPYACQKAQGTLRGFEGGAQLDADRLAEEMGKVFLHLAVEDEGDVGVELLLKLEQLALPMLPRAGLEHGEDQDILTGVVRKCIKHPGPLDSGSRRRAVLAGQIFSDGYHT